MNWRTGRKVFRTVYIRDDDFGDGALIGCLDTPGYARLACDAVNLLGPTEEALVELLYVVQNATSAERHDKAITEATLAVHVLQAAGELP